MPRKWCVEMCSEFCKRHSFNLYLTIDDAKILKEPLRTPNVFLQSDKRSLIFYRRFIKFVAVFAFCVYSYHRWNEFENVADVVDEQTQLFNEISDPNYKLIAQKLIGLPTIVWISIAAQDSNRFLHMQDLFTKTGLANVAHRGVICQTRDDCKHLAEYTYKRFRFNGQIGCSIAHLNAIRYFYEETDLEHIIIAEDDMTLDTVQYWLHNWEYYFSRIPSDFDVVQLIAPNTFTARRVAEKYNRTIMPEPMQKVTRDWGAVMYMLTRAAAEKLVRRYLLPDGKWNLDDKNVKGGPVSEHLVFSLPNMYVWNLFTMKLWLERSQVNVLRTPDISPTSLAQLLEWRKNPI